MQTSIRRAGALALCALGVLIGASIARTDDKAGTIAAGKLAKHPEEYYGKTVSVRAEVEDVFGSNMFTLDEDALFAGPDVLVLVPKGLSATLMHDQKVTVTGRVRRYVEAELKKDYDWFDHGKLVNVKHKVEWETRPVVVAASIRTEDGRELLSE